MIHLFLINCKGTTASSIEIDLIVAAISHLWDSCLLNDVVAYGWYFVKAVLTKQSKLPRVNLMLDSGHLLRQDLFFALVLVLNSLSIHTKDVCNEYSLLLVLSVDQIACKESI